MLKRSLRKVGLALAAAGALCLSTWTGAEARPFGLLLGGGFHHLGGFGGGFRPKGFGGPFHSGAFGFHQAGVGYPGFRQAGVDYHGSGRGRYWGAYGAAAAVGSVGAYSGGYTTTDSDDSDARAYRHGYPAYGY